jgi:hypothetical protein
MNIAWWHSFSARTGATVMDDVFDDDEYDTDEGNEEAETS